MEKAYITTAASSTPFQSVGLYHIQIDTQAHFNKDFWILHTDDAASEQTLPVGLIFQSEETFPDRIQ